MQTLWTQSFAGNGFNKYGHYVRGEFLLYPVGACATTSQGRGSTYGSCSANFDGGNPPSGSIASATARIAGIGVALNSIASSLVGKSVVVHPFGWPSFKPTKADLKKLAAKKKPAAKKPTVVKPVKGGGGKKPKPVTTPTTTPTTAPTTTSTTTPATTAAGGGNG
jgi:hypothetical protein